MGHMGHLGDILHSAVAGMGGVDAASKMVTDVAKRVGEQEAAQKSLLDQEETTSVSGSNKMAEKAKTLDKFAIRKSEKTGDSVLVRLEFEEAANDLLKRHPDFKKDELVELHGKMRPGMSEEQILKEVQLVCKKPSQAVDVLKFLEATTPSGVRENISNVRKICEYCEKNPEFTPGDLVKLGKDIKSGMPGEQIFKEVQNAYQEPSQIYKALQILQEIKTGDLQEQLAAVRKSYFVSNRDDIIISRNVEAIIQTSVKGNVGTGKEIWAFHNKIKDDLPDMNAFVTLMNEKYKDYSHQQLIGLVKTVRAAFAIQIKKPGMEAGEINALMKEIKILRTYKTVLGFTANRLNLVIRCAESQFTPFAAA
jgi:hypothetical protein